MNYISSGAYSVISLSWHLKKSIRFFQQSLLMILLILTSMRFTILLEAARQLWGKNLTILFIHCEEILNSFRRCISLNGFLRKIMSWSAVNPSCLFHLEVYSFRQAISQKVLSSHHLYSNLSRYLPFLECLSNSVGKKFTNKSIRTILLILNNLIE